MSVLIAAMIFFARKYRTNVSGKILFNLCLALLFALLVFVAGIERAEEESTCVAIAVLLHYFILVVFLWMGVEAFYMFFNIVLDRFPGGHGSTFVMKCAAIAWGKTFSFFLSLSFFFSFFFLSLFIFSLFFFFSFLLFFLFFLSFFLSFFILFFISSYFSPSFSPPSSHVYSYSDVLTIFWPNDSFWYFFVVLPMFLVLITVLIRTDDYKDQSL